MGLPRLCWVRNCPGEGLEVYVLELPTHLPATIVKPSSVSSVYSRIRFISTATDTLVATQDVPPSRALEYTAFNKGPKKVRRPREYDGRGLLVMA
jgi:hypothetical protein